MDGYMTGALSTGVYQEMYASAVYYINLSGVLHTRNCRSHLIKMAYTDVESIIFT